MTFFIGRGFAELQILKKWKWPYLLNWVEYCDEILFASHFVPRSFRTQVIRTYFGHFVPTFWSFRTQ